MSIDQIKNRAKKNSESMALNADSTQDLESIVLTKPKEKLLSATLKEKNVLYAAYMPFLQRGGLFVPTNKSFAIGEAVFLLLDLMDEAEKLPVEGTVVWVTPHRAQSNRVAGVGIQFGEESEAVRNKIEVYLAGLLHSERTTHTM